MTSKGFKLKTDAEAWARAREREIDKGEYLDGAEARNHTVADMLNRYIKEALPKKKPYTRLKQESHARWWIERLGKLHLNALTAAKMVEARSALAADGAGPATQNRYMALLSHCCTVAVKEWQWLKSNPVRNIAKQREPAGRVRYLSDDERKRLFAAIADDPELNCAVRVALSSAMRQGEQFALRWRDINLKNGNASLRDTKGNVARSTTIAGEALELLRERWRGIEAEHKGKRVVGIKDRLRERLVFPSSSDPAKPYYFRDPWNAALEAAKIKNFKWHDLRHTALSYAAMRGASTIELAAMAGHKTLAMVLRYAHLSPSHSAGIVRAMVADMDAGKRMTT
ncbi:MAG: site-specific integrase [Deltaproteobacteria bacterium]|nr:site-specific integrase [Deltaproteobacteria bacterium]